MHLRRVVALDLARGPVRVNRGAPDPRRAWLSTRVAVRVVRPYHPNGAGLPILHSNES